MPVIHSQTGTIEAPLATLEDQLSETSKNVLQKTAQAAMSQAPIKNRARWWWTANAERWITVAFLLGAVAGAVVFRKG